MSTRIEKAAELKNSMNCAQAVAVAHFDYTDLTQEQIKALTQGFGGGIGGTQDGTCGAITGACMIVGLCNKGFTKEETVKKCAYIMNSFKERNGAVGCHSIKGRETGQVLRSCVDCVRDAAEFLEDVID